MDGKPERKAKQKFRFTKTALLAVQCPPGQKCVYAYDADTPGLGARITPAGTVTFIFLKLVRGKTIRKNLTRPDPGNAGTKGLSIMRLDNTTVEQARAAARAEHVEVDSSPTQYLESAKGIDAHKITLEDAFKAALAGSSKGRHSDLGLRDWNQARDKFLAWMQQHFSHVQTWADLRRDHVTQYKDSLKPTKANIARGKKRLSDTRVRLLLQPIIQTGKYMLLEHKLPNEFQELGLSAKLSKKTASVYLVDVLAFLDYLKDQQLYSLEAGAALAGLAGLQLLEALRLTWNKADFKRGLVEISGEVKNEFRARVIPVHKRVIEALQRAHDHRIIGEVEPVDGGYVVTSPSGKGFIEVSWQNYSLRLGRAIRAWNPKVDWAPKDLRNCILTTGDLRGFAGAILEQYVGHAPGTVTAKNYIPRLGSATEGEAEALEEAMDHFRRLVVDNLEVEIQRIKAKKVGKHGAAAVVELGAK